MECSYIFAQFVSTIGFESRIDYARTHARSDYLVHSKLLSKKKKRVRTHRTQARHTRHYRVTSAITRLEETRRRNFAGLKISGAYADEGKNRVRERESCPLGTAVAAARYQTAG